MYQNFWTLIKEIKSYTDFAQNISDGNQEIILTNILFGQFSHYDEVQNLVIIDYIHANTSENLNDPRYEISAFMNDFKLKMHTIGDFYLEDLPPKKKVKNQISFILEEFGTFELYIKLINFDTFSDDLLGKISLTIDS